MFVADPSVTIRLFQGEDLTVSCTIRDADGNLMDLSAADIVWKVRKYDDSPVLIEKEDGDGITVTGMGTIDIALVPVDTTALAGRHRHECRITVAGKVRTAFQGYITVDRTIV